MHVHTLYNNSQLHEPIESVELRCYAEPGAGGNGADELDVLGGAFCDALVEGKFIWTSPLLFFPINSIPSHPSLGQHRQQRRGR
jgi:hypothetical protein